MTIGKGRSDKFSRDEEISLMFDLINAFRLVKTPNETALLMQDLLTADEIKHLAKRLRIAKLLLSGETQRDISKDLDCSLATTVKVSLWLRQGGQGLKNIISRLPTKYTIPKNLPPIPIEFQLPSVLLATAQYVMAKRQNTQPEKLIQKIQTKKELDRILQKEFDQQFKEQHPGHRKYLRPKY